MELHPQFIEKDGKRVFAILPCDEFTALYDALEDALDSLALREAREENRGKPTYSTDEVKAMFGLKSGRTKAARAEAPAAKRAQTSFQPWPGPKPSPAGGLSSASWPSVGV